MHTWTQAHVSAHRDAKQPPPISIDRITLAKQKSAFQVMVISDNQPPIIIPSDRIKGMSQKELDVLADKRKFGVEQHLGDIIDEPKWRVFN